MYGKDGLRLGKNYKRNAIQELEWLKLQLVVDEEEIELMVMEENCKDVIHKTKQ